MVGYRWLASWVRPYESEGLLLQNFSWVNALSRADLRKLLGNDSLSLAKAADFERLFRVSPSLLSHARDSSYNMGALAQVRPDGYRDREFKFCPECAKHSFHTPLFNLPWVVRCPTHSSRLLVTCPKCGGGLHAIWDVDQPGCERCGHDIFNVTRGPRSGPGADAGPYLAWTKALSHRVSARAVLFGSILTKHGGDSGVPNWKELPGYLLHLLPWRGEVCPMDPAADGYHRSEQLPRSVRLADMFIPPTYVLHAMTRITRSSRPARVSRNFEILRTVADSTFRSAKKDIRETYGPRLSDRSASNAPSDGFDRLRLALTLWTDYWETMVTGGTSYRVPGFGISTFDPDPAFLLLALAVAPREDTSRASDAGFSLCEWVARRLFSAYVWASLESAWQLANLADGDERRISIAYGRALKAAAPTFIIDSKDRRGPTLHWWARPFSGAVAKEEGLEREYVSPPPNRGPAKLASLE